MNENIDLTKILKDCPKGWKLYSTINGNVYFNCIEKNNNKKYPIIIELETGTFEKFTSDGKLFSNYGECILFPSKDQRDWSKFTAPWYKKEKFDPKTLKPFDRILTIHKHIWVGRIVSHIEEDMIFVTSGGFYDYCVPYNDETKHLVGTTEEAPEYYKYWEN